MVDPKSRDLNLPVFFAILPVVAIISLVLALLLGGGAPAAGLPGIPDPGVLTGWTVPVLNFVTRAGAVVSIGFLIAAAFLIPADDTFVKGLAARATRIASHAGLIWGMAALALYVFTVSDVFARPLNEIWSWALWVSLYRDSVLGPALLIQALIAFALALLTRLTLSTRGIAWLVLLALTGMVPPAIAGHAAGAGAHDLAVFALVLHTWAAAIWVGALIALLWLAWHNSKRLEATIQRYSPIALFAVAMLALSGIVSAIIRVGSVSGLWSGYGAIVITKSVVLLTLVILGGRQRQRIARKDTAGFASLAVLELGLMALVLGLSSALARTPAVVQEFLLTEIQAVLGVALPPDPSPLRLAIGWYPSGFGVSFVLLAAAMYLIGVRIMVRRGDRWPFGRTLSWFVGLAIIGWATFGGLGLYSHVLFSAHMVSHMMLSMVAPIFLVLGAPVTLALRTLPGPRAPGEISPRQMLNDFLHSRYVRVITHPATASFLFAGSLYGVYFTGLFETLMSTHWGHVLMEFHFLAAGSLFFYVIIGIDPAPRRLPAFARFAMLMITIPFHAFFSIAVMSSSTLIAEEYFSALGRDYNTDLLADQYLGGGIAWAMGEVPLVIVMIALFVQWLRSDRRESARLDRAAERDGDAELKAYNEYLAHLGSQAGPGSTAKPGERSPQQ